ncbi:MAG: hypothetical protein DSM106950_38285, partial [Stigonema ocellatum SAG 48.90 = DSM 106950]|nr:hypothetical protein [Stigonema ocellatum SAG 48.90 = DSM 106950]
FASCLRQRLRRTRFKNLFEPRRHEEHEEEMSKIGRNFPNFLPTLKGLVYSTYELTETTNCVLSLVTRQ